MQVVFQPPAVIPIGIQMSKCGNKCFRSNCHRLGTSLLLFVSRSFEAIQGVQLVMVFVVKIFIVFLKFNCFTFLLLYVT